MSVEEITVDELESVLASAARPTDVRLIDVREADEFEEFRVPGAVHVPLAAVPERLEAFAGDGPTYVICLAGGRSMRACELVSERSGQHVINVAGGTQAWAASGRPTETGPA